MSARSWFRGRFTSSSPAASSRGPSRRRLRPTVLALEGRTLLSTFTVTNDTVDDVNTPDTLRWAITQANAATSPSSIAIELGSTPATITLTQGQLELSNTSDSTKIYDGPSQGAVTVSGNNASRVFQIDGGVTASISGLTITDGNAAHYSGVQPSYGGGLYNKGTVTLTNCILSGNSASFTPVAHGTTFGGGGTLENYNGKATLTDCTVSGNSADFDGGGLFNRGVRGTANMTLTDCTVSGNSADSDGGGLYNSAYDGTANMTLTDCTVSGNAAAAGGGLSNSAYDGTANMTLTDCTVSGNAAPEGGILRSTGNNNNDTVTMTLSDCTVSDNHGSGVFIRLSTAILTDCTVSGNPGTGGLYNGDGTFTLTNCTISGNSGYGGGLLNLYGTNTLTNCTISGNVGLTGGGVCNDGGRVTLTDCTLSGNIAGIDGGGLYNKGAATLIDCTVSGNTAVGLSGAYGVGGGVWAAIGVTLTDCTVSGNAGESAGGLWFGSPYDPSLLTNTIVAGNTSRGGGSASDIISFGGPGGVSGSYDLIGTGGSGGLTNGVDHNQVGVNPLLGDLGDYGGPTATIPLLPGSSAIGTGDPNRATDPISNQTVTTDQRGYQLPAAGTPQDIGAFQDQGFTLTPVAGSTPQTATVATAFANPLAMTVTANNTAQFTDPVDGGVIGFAVNPAADGASAALSAATATIAGGRASVITATANTVAGSYTVTASAAGVATPTSFGLTNTPGAPASIKVVSGSPQSTTVAQCFASPLLVVVKDTYLNVVPNVSVTFAAPAFGASATLVPSSATTGADGRASVKATANTIAGSYIVTASVAGVATQAGFGLTNTPAAANHFEVTTSFGNPDVAGTNGTVTVTAMDPYNNVATGYARTIHFTSSDKQAVTGNELPDDYTFWDGDNGVHTFTNSVTLKTAGMQSITATDTANSSIAGTSPTVNVAPAAATQLVVSGFPSPVFAGTPGMVAVTAKDQFGNVDSSGPNAFNGMVAITSSDTHATLPSPAALSNGTGSFAVTLTTAGAQSITATSVSITGSQSNITVTPAAAASIKVVSGSPQSTTVGQAFASPLLVLVKDIYLNVVPNVSVTFAAPTSGASATLSSSTATTGADGGASVKATANTIAGSYNVTASVAGVATPASFALTQALPATGVSVIGTVLYIFGGSTSSDTASVKPAGAQTDGSTGLAVSATLNKVSVLKTFTQTFTAIIVAGYAGNETFTLASTLTLPATVTAGNGNDVVQLGGGDNTVVLGDGNDTVSAGGGNNTVTVGNGNDAIQLGDGSNVVIEGNGNDTISAGNGNNLIVGGLGPHTIKVGNGRNILIDGSAAVSFGKSFRDILNIWSNNPNASGQAQIRPLLTVNDNAKYANTLMAGTGSDWFFYQSPTTSNKKRSDFQN